MSAFHIVSRGITRLVDDSVRVVRPTTLRRPSADACMVAAVIVAFPLLLIVGAADSTGRGSWGVIPHGASERLVIIEIVIFATLIVLMLRALRKAALANLHYKDIIDHANDGIIVCDAISHQVLYANTAIQDRLGYEPQSMIGLSLQAVLRGACEGSMPFEGRRQRDHDSSLPIDAQCICKDRSLIDVEVRCSQHDMNGNPVTAYITRDVSVSRKVELQLIENQKRLARIAHHDQLTGLPNRHYIAAFLPEAIASAKAEGTQLGILFLDLDRFKHINDTYGHETGDKLLQVVATRLRQCVRNEDVIVRMGGDEFVIVFLNLQSESEIALAAGRIITALNAPIVIAERSLQTSASLGISLFPRDGDSMVELLKHSDAAMYQAKDGGRNNVQTFNPDMNRRLKHRVAVETMLREAIRLKQLDVHYQPFINLATRKTVGLEALVRWKHPAHGFIPPDWFIPIAEETGLVMPIGNFVLHRVMQDMSSWRRSGMTLVPVSLNVAASQLLRGEYQAKIVTLLKSHDIAPDLIQLEMTERGVFDSRSAPSGENRQDAFAGLRDIGIKIAIDDFGTGYSSLAYLKHWRIDVLKIDKSFVRDLVTNASDFAIVSAIIAIARNLHIEVIAEGIEAYQQADILQKLGCHHGQGFLFARPMPAAKCLAFLTKGPTSDLEDSDILAPLVLTGGE